MATFTKWAVPNNPTGLQIMTTELNSLANGSYTIASVVGGTGVYDNTSNLDLIADFLLNLAYTTTAPGAGTKVGELYLLPSIDGTNFASVDGSNVPQQATFIGAVECRLPSTSTLEPLVIMGVPIPPRKFKLIFKNTSGQTLKASGNTIAIAPYQLQAA